MTFLREEAVELYLISLLQLRLLPQCFLKTAGCKVLSYASFSAFNEQSGSYWLCYYFTWARYPSLLGCVDTGYISLLQYLLPIPKVLKRTGIFSCNL